MIMLEAGYEDYCSERCVGSTIVRHRSRAQMRRNPYYRLGVRLRYESFYGKTA